jgi:SPP1 gp7 family putative phage head morphogenesis protein
MDETSARDLEREIARLGDRWNEQFARAAPKLAEWFLQSTKTRSDKVLAKILRDGGFSVKFQTTKAMRDAMQATLAEQVGLIKSIPQQYLTQVQTMVMQSVKAGHDVGALAKQIEKQYGVTKRRAQLIARDQNNKATATMTRVRQIELGIEEAIWSHSHGGRKPRPTHLANDGKRYRIADGWRDPDPKVNRRIWPGELINCRCVARAVVKGFS